MSDLNILDAISDPKVFGQHFRNRESWAGWFAFLAALFGLRMDADMRRVFMDCTQRHDRPSQLSTEAWLIIGRRGGKSFVLALIAVFLACFRDYRPFLGPGERATVMVIAADRKQARVIMRYVKGLLATVPMLKRLIEAERQESVDLANTVTIEVHTASFRTVRGYTIVAALLDELAFWQGEDGANPDTEIINAIKPAMATIPGPSCCAPRLLMRGAVPCGRRSKSISARPVRSSSGKRPRAR